MRLDESIRDAAFGQRHMHPSGDSNHSPAAGPYPSPPWDERDSAALIGYRIGGVGVSVGTGQSVYVYTGARFLGAAVRDGRGWTIHIDGAGRHADCLDGVLRMLDALPDHRARGRR